jgi:hypothetical protein
MWRMKATRTPLQQLSKTVFNAEHRLTLVTALQAADQLVTTAVIAEATHVAYSTVHDELNLLAELGVLQRICPERQVLFQPLSGPFWEWCTELTKSIKTGEPKSSSAAPESIG